MWRRSLVGVLCPWGVPRPALIFITWFAFPPSPEQQLRHGGWDELDMQKYYHGSRCNGQTKSVLRERSTSGETRCSKVTTSTHTEPDIRLCSAWIFSLLPFLFTLYVVRPLITNETPRTESWYYINDIITSQWERENWTVSQCVLYLQDCDEAVRPCAAAPAVRARRLRWVTGLGFQPVTRGRHILFLIYITKPKGHFVHFDRESERSAVYSIHYILTKVNTYETKWKYSFRSTCCCLTPPLHLLTRLQKHSGLHNRWPLSGYTSYLQDQQNKQTIVTAIVATGWDYVSEELGL
jgi:hypothetical protein